MTMSHYPLRKIGVECGFADRSDFRIIFEMLLGKRPPTGVRGAVRRMPGRLSDRAFDPYCCKVMATWRHVVDENEREMATTAALNLQTTGFTWQDRSSSSMDSRLRLSDYADAETSSGDCNREAQDTGGELLDDNPDGNSFDFLRWDCKRYWPVVSPYRRGRNGSFNMVAHSKVRECVTCRGPPTPASKLLVFH
jgi:hypothetical protein